MKITKLKTLTILCCLLATTFVCSAQTFDENGFNTNPSATDNQYQEPTVTDGVYQIANAGNLYWFADFVNQGGDNAKANAVLANDITVNENLLSSLVKNEDGNVTNGSDFKAWTPIGTNGNRYMGKFDGKGNTVSGLYFNDGTKDYVGLFGYIGSGATVQNVGVIDSYIRGYNCVGGVVGDNDGGAIINVYNAGSVSAAGGSVGGVVGINLGSISNVYNTGSVSGSSYVGGVAGSSVNGTVSNVYNTGSVRGAGGGVGGVVGINNWGSISKACNTGSVSGDHTRVGGVVGTNNGTIGNVYNTGSVSGSSYVGGVVGTNNGTISNVYNTGSVSGTNDVGGVVGGNNGGDINNAYYDNQTCNNCNSYGTGKTLAELANLTVGNGGDFPLLEGETESPWAKGIYYDKATGKLANSELPYLKSLPVVPDAETILSFTVASGVIQISTAEDLKNFAKLVNEYHITDVDAELTTNLTVNSNLLGENNANVDAETGEYTGNTPANVWTPIGTSSAKYTGTFDGNGYTIRGLYFNDESTEYVGLFGYIDESAKVQNVGVVDSYFKGYQYVGGVVGYNYNGTVSNVYNTGSVSGSSYVGGVVGYNDGGTVSNAYNTGSVSGSGDNVGGVVGANYGTVSNAYNTGSVRGTGIHVGGVVGANYGTVSNGFFNTAYYSGTAIGESEGTADNVKGLSMTDLANLTIGNGGDFPLLEGETESPWVVCSGNPVVSNGKLVYKFPGLKIFGSQPEVVLFNVQKGSDGIDYCEIANADDLFKFAQLVNDGATGLNAKLTADICVNGCDEGEKSLLEQVAELEAKGELLPESFKQWIPMNVSNAKTVAFDGNGHTISGLYLNKENSSQIGLFGQVVGDVSVSNLGVVDFYVNGNGEVGSLAGQVTGKLNIKNCYSAGSVKGVHYVGGIVGVNRDGAELKIENSYNESSVNAPSGIVGGLVGENYNYASLTITNSYNVGAVSGKQYVGGLVGDNYTYAIITIENSYNVGTVSGEGFVGGLVGVNEEGTLNVSNSFFVETNGDGDGLAGEAKTSDEFANGTVAKLLFTADPIWGQNTSTDTIPNFSGKIIFTVSVTASDNGTVSGASGEYEYNSQLVFVATPNEGYHFVKWSNGSTKTNDTILVVSDTALVATFTAHEFGKWDTIQAATCTEYGLRVHTCSCGAFDIDTIPALGHSFTNYIYNNDATIESYGTETATCDHEGCHATDTRIAEGPQIGTAVNDLETENIHIYAHNYTIVIEHAANDIIVYDAKGQLITHRTVTGNSTEQINVINSGIYTVNCGNTTKCVICN